MYDVVVCAPAGILYACLWLFIVLCVGGSRYCPVAVLVPDLPDQHSPLSSWSPEIPPGRVTTKGGLTRAGFWRGGEEGDGLIQVARLEGGEEV